MKKKIIAISLITAMVVCNSMISWAAHSGVVNTNGGTDSSDVTGTYDLSATGTDSYNVDITWGSLAYKMKDDASTKGTWNATNKCYDIENFKGWVSTEAGTADKITVSNKSNVAIKATFSGNIECGTGTVLGDTYGVTSGAVAFSGLETGDVLKLNTYEGASEVPTESGTVSVTDTIITKAPSLKNDTGLKLGTVTVTIAKQE